MSEPGYVGKVRSKLIPVAQAQELLRQWPGAVAPAIIRFGPETMQQRMARESQNHEAAKAMVCAMRHPKLGLYGSQFCFTCGWI